MAERQQRILLSVRGELERYALAVLLGEHGLLADLDRRSASASGNDYTVTMAIPIKIMRGSGGVNSWKVQFVRIIRSTGERQIWTYGSAQTTATT